MATKWRVTGWFLLLTMALSACTPAEQTEEEGESEGSDGGQTFPDPFSFATLNNQPLNTVVVSDVVTLSGFSDSMLALVTGVGASLLVNGSVVGGSAMVEAGDSVQIRLSTASAYATPAMAKLNIAALEVWFVAYTAADESPNVFDFTDVTDAALNALITSDEITLAGFTGDLTATVSGTGSPILVRNGDDASTSTDVQAGDTLRIKLTSSGSNSTARTATLQLGDLDVTWSVTTLAPVVPDSIPDAFDFTDQTSPGINDTYARVLPVTGTTQSTIAIAQSNIVTLTGFNQEISATVSGTGSPILIKNGQEAGTTVEVVSGDKLAVRMTNAGACTPCTATVSVGTQAASFAVQSVTVAQRRFRLMFTDDPSSKISIAWESVGASAATARLYYSQTDHGTDIASYGTGIAPTHTYDGYLGMNTGIVALTGLEPNTTYYFVIADAAGRSNRFSFRTMPDDPSIKLSIIEGGDSRTNPEPRRRGNIMVKRFRPHVVLFGGDYTDDSADYQWREWLDDWWQFTVGDDGRMIPMIGVKGNHEPTVEPLQKLLNFDPRGYYSVGIAGNLFRVYSLDTELASTDRSDQTQWFTEELDDYSNESWWDIVMYHRAMRPHTHNKVNGVMQYEDWASLIDAHRVSLVIESDSHLAKYTYPIRKDASLTSALDDGMVRDENTGAVYIGEGGWGAPLTPVNWFRKWTRNAEALNHVHWIVVEQHQIQIRTLKTGNADAPNAQYPAPGGLPVGQLTDANLFADPANLLVWNPTNGGTVTIAHPTAPTITFTSPVADSIHDVGTTVTIAVDVSANTDVTSVEFFNGATSIGIDTTAPYSVDWIVSGSGSFTFTAKATDSENLARTSGPVSITGVVGGTTILELSVSSSGDDSEERTSNGTISLTSSDLELIDDGGNAQTVGLRFKPVTIPQGATITAAYIQFTADEIQSEITNLNIAGHAADNAAFFSSNAFDLSSRPLTSATVAWNAIPTWIGDGVSTSDQRTPDLSAIVQEIVNRPGWVSTNRMVFLFTGTGHRTAQAYDRDPAAAPLLHIEYE